MGRKNGIYFTRWHDTGLRETLPERITKKPAFERLIIHTKHVKTHPHAVGAKSGNQAMGRAKGGNTKIHPAIDAHGIPVQVVIMAWNSLWISRRLGR
jgi:hypothetical protein